MTYGSKHVLSRAEYDSTSRADHGTIRRFLAGCRCPRCETPGNYRFLDRAERSYSRDRKAQR